MKRDNLLELVEEAGEHGARGDVAIHELVVLAQAGDRSAADEVVKLFLPGGPHRGYLIEAVEKYLRLPSVEKDEDLKAEVLHVASAATFTATKTWRAGAGSSFKTYLFKWAWRSAITDFLDEEVGTDAKPSWRRLRTPLPEQGGVFDDERAIDPGSGGNAGPLTGVLTMAEAPRGDDTAQYDDRDALGEQGEGDAREDVMPMARRLVLESGAGGASVRELLALLVPQLLVGLARVRPRAALAAHAYLYGKTSTFVAEGEDVSVKSATRWRDEGLNFVIRVLADVLEPDALVGSLVALDAFRRQPLALEAVPAMTASVAKTAARDARVQAEVRSLFAEARKRSRRGGKMGAPAIGTQAEWKTMTKERSGTVARPPTAVIEELLRRGPPGFEAKSLDATRARVLRPRATKRAIKPAAAGQETR